jgi:hypothetical protein
VNNHKLALAGLAVWLLVGGVCLRGYAQAELDERRQRLESLSPSEKRELLAKKERFDDKSESERQRLRELDAQIRQHPQAEQLQQVLQRYGQWLATLSSKDRAELQELPPADRLERIQQLREGELDRRLSELGLTAHDAEKVFQWWESFLEQHEALLVEALNPPDQEAYAKENGERRDRSFMLRFAVWRSLGTVLRRVPRDDINRLIPQLSQTARNRFLGLEGVEEQNQLLERWLRESFRWRMRPPPATNDELLRIIKELPAEERERLEKLPRDELVQRLRERWESQQMWRRRGPPRRFPPGRDEGRGRGERFRDERFRDRDRDRGEPPLRRPAPPTDHRRNCVEPAHQDSIWVRAASVATTWAAVFPGRRRPLLRRRRWSAPWQWRRRRWPGRTESARRPFR